MLDLAADFEHNVRFIWCAAPREVCAARVRATQGDSAHRRAARLRFISEAADECFEPRDGEDVAELYSGLGECRVCGDDDAELARCPQCSADNDVCVDCVAAVPESGGGNASPRSQWLRRRKHERSMRCDDCNADSSSGSLQDLEQQLSLLRPRRRGDVTSLLAVSLSGVFVTPKL